MPLYSNVCRALLHSNVDRCVWLVSGGQLFTGIKFLEIFFFKFKIFNAIARNILSQIREQILVPPTFYNVKNTFLVVGCWLGWTVIKRFGPIISNFWGPFLKVFMGKKLLWFFFEIIVGLPVGTEKLHRIKVNKIQKKIWKAFFMGGKTVFLRLKIWG